MGRPLLPRVNNILEKILTVILCAGEGERLKRITQHTPKPLIRIKSLDNNPIIHNIINNLIKLKISNISLVIGHLGPNIKKYINEIKEKNNILDKALKVWDSKNEYKITRIYRDNV